MFAGKLPADDNTLNLIANDLALDVHAFSSNLQVSYQGNCDCTPNPQQSEFACRPLNAHGTQPCVAVWWALMPNEQCRALALLNIGTSTAPSVKVRLGTLGLDGKDTVAWNVTNIYESSSKLV